MGLVQRFSARLVTISCSVTVCAHCENVGRTDFQLYQWHGATIVNTSAKMTSYKRALVYFSCIFPTVPALHLPRLINKANLFVKEKFQTV